MKSDLTTILESFVDLDQEYLFEYLLDEGKTVKDFPIELRTPDNEISGCQSRVWVLGEQVNGQWNFAIDSDAYIVKGIGKLLCTTFNGCKTQDVLDIKFHDFKPIAGLLTTQRQRGIQSVINSIHYLVNTDK
tara:strand:- start:111 stop:506 length:396 start_codon:yes stop_codon:yes gene_type:complete